MPTGQASPSIPTGIPMPALQNRFFVRVEATPQTFMMQTIAFAFNFSKKELLLLVEQSASNPTREHDIILDMIANPGRIVTFESLDMNGKILDTIKFEGTKVIDHHIEFNYALAGAAHHELMMSYDKVDTGNGTSQSAYSSAMSIVGKRGP